MAELRYNPMIGDWVMIASNRQKRPVMPKGYCPFCEGAKNIPEHYDVHRHDNDFPALSQTPPEPDDVATELYPVRKSHGKCEVILFSPDHNGSLYDLSDSHLLKLVNLWCERFDAMKEDPLIKYVFIFENRGDLVGVTQPHPHGQIYGYSVLPKKIEIELDYAKKYKKEHGRCLFCDINKDEAEFGRRVITENEDFIAYIPFFADYAYGVYIAAKKHVSNITQLDESGRQNLGLILRDVTGAYDRIFDKRFPYMMCMHNGPVNMEGEFAEYSDSDDYFHFHIEMYPPLRTENVQQYQASSETGVWAHCNPTAPETMAPKIRHALAKFKGELPMYYFRELSAIPRGSGNESAVAKWLAAFAGEHGIECTVDEFNNVHMSVPASAGYENTPAIILQGHTDMVCEKNKGTVHDFEKDGIKLIEKDGILTADGTTLGADDGVSVAIMLALLDDNTLEHPAMECLFTATEETGLIGAHHFDTSKLKARRMVNIDSAEEDHITVSCSGGVRTHMKLAAEKSPAAGTLAKIFIRGLKGGHSGEDINKNRANAIKLASEIISEADGDFRIVSYNGGNKDNAIPRECEADLFIDAADAGKLKAAAERVAAANIGREPSLKLTVEFEEAAADAFTADASRRLIGAITDIPDGVRAYETFDSDKPASERAVRSSDNLAVVATKPEGFALTVSSRSSVEADNDAMEVLLDNIAKPKGITLSHDQRYSGWKFVGETPLFREYSAAYKRCFPDRAQPVIFSIHAGLECAIFKAALPDLDVISIGCDVKNLHSVDEQMDIASFRRVYTAVRELILTK